MKLRVMMPALGPAGLVPLQLTTRKALQTYWQRLRLAGIAFLCVLTLIQIVMGIIRLSAGAKPSADADLGTTGQFWLVTLFMAGLTGLALGLHRAIKEPSALFVKAAVAAAVILIGIGVNYVGVRGTQLAQQSAPPSEFDSFVGSHFLEELLPPWGVALIPSLFMLAFTFLGIATSVVQKRIATKGKATFSWLQVLLSTALASSFFYAVLALTSLSTDPAAIALVTYLSGYFWQTILQALSKKRHGRDDA